MSKQIDLEKPLSDENRAWLQERSLNHLVEANDRQFNKKPAEPKIDKKTGSQELKTTGAPDNWEPGTEPKHEFAKRPFDPPISGYFATETSEPLEEVEEVEEVDIDDLTVDEVKEELRELGLSVSGSRDDLVKRLKKAQ